VFSKLLSIILYPSLKTFLYATSLFSLIDEGSVVPITKGAAHTTTNAKHLSVLPINFNLNTS
jgi:hypothetical protein